MKALYYRVDFNINLGRENLGISGSESKWESIDI